MSLGGGRMWKVCFIYTKKWDSWFYVFFNSPPDFLSAIFGISVKFHVDIGVQMWSWDELELPIRNFGAKIIADSRFRISHQTSVVCCCVQVTECVCKWETVCSKSFSVFFRKTIHFRVSNPGWGNRTDPIPSEINPSVVQVSQFRLRCSQSLTMTPATNCYPPLPPIVTRSNG